MFKFFNNLKAKIFTKTEDFTEKMDPKVAFVFWTVIVVIFMLIFFGLFCLLLNTGVI